ncbi:MAG: transglutaminase domain-containing protein, partial [FCB group bacterium]|nr:transglutaminase domain-containing protein [FCB group bacterium]
LVYLQGRFLFHAWPVVAIDGEWVDVDPSLNQFPADATHIALVEGDFENLTNLIPVLGNVKIEILEQVY